MKGETGGEDPAQMPGWSLRATDGSRHRGGRIHGRRGCRGQREALHGWLCLWFLQDVQGDLLGQP